jgi:hypothetical protein
VDLEGRDSATTSGSAFGQFLSSDSASISGSSAPLTSTCSQEDLVERSTSGAQEGTKKQEKKKGGNARNSIKRKNPVTSDTNEAAAESYASERGVELVQENTDAESLPMRGEEGTIHWQNEINPANCPSSNPPSATPTAKKVVEKNKKGK